MTSIREYIAELTGCRSPVFTGVGGGSINQAWRVEANGKLLFCKVNSASRYPGLFAREAHGLDTLRRTGCIQTPAVIGVHSKDDLQLLLLEWIKPGAGYTGDFWQRFGRQLAALHLCKGPQTAPGFEENNYMGALPQDNTPMDNWCDFFRERRLKPQVRLALRQQLLPASCITHLENLYGRLPDIFPPSGTSLLHGDLWSGNFVCSDQQTPVLIDPAVYYGHASMDLAMTTLFGGFDKAFYDAYAYWNPLPPNYREQWEVCNLYPLLIHLNLFGQGYLSSVTTTLRRFG